MLVGGVFFIWDLKGKPLTETGVSRVIGMPRATLARRIDLLIKEGWVMRCRNRYYFDFDKFGRRSHLSSHLRSVSRAIAMAARRLPDPGSS
jgi:DNA-binding IclR family transcriptional regulator